MSGILYYSVPSSQKQSPAAQGLGGVHSGAAANTKEQTNFRHSSSLPCDCPCPAQPWLTAMCPFSTVSCPGCNSLPAELSDDTSTWLEAMTGDFFHYWMIQPGLQRGNFRLFCLEKAQPASYPAREQLSLAQCLPPPIPAQRWHHQPPVTTAAPR